MTRAKKDIELPKEIKLKIEDIEIKLSSDNSDAGIPNFDYMVYSFKKTDAISTNQ